MRVITQNPSERITFFEVHAPQWVERASEIGLSDEQAALVQAQTIATREAFARAYAAAQEARAATSAWQEESRRLRTIGGHAVQSIKAFAQSRSTEAETSDVYETALLPIPGRGGPKRRSQGERDAAVPRVRNVNAFPDAHGRITLRWTCGQGATMGAGTGMSYAIERWTNNDRATAQIIAVVGGPGAGRRDNTYIDDQVPSGTASVCYCVTPHQAGGVGRASLAVTVNFGTIAGAFTGASKSGRAAA